MSSDLAGAPDSVPAAARAATPSDEVSSKGGHSADTPQNAANDDASPSGARDESMTPARLHLVPSLGPRSQSDKQHSKSNNPIAAIDSPTADERRVTFDATRSDSLPLHPHDSHGRASQHDALRRGSMERRRSSINPKLRPEEAVYHDSRAATRREFRRRATTLQDYYRHNPTLLPQLPFTFRHGFKRWKLALVVAFMVFDACVVPIVLYYALTFGGDVQGFITFAIVTAIWGGPAYVEFAVRSWRLVLRERFFRPLGVRGRWGFDATNWIFVASITATTALLVVGAAPHIVWLRVLSLPGPALLLVMGACIALLTLANLAGWRAPFRISSTAKGEAVHPGVYYIVEDIIAVNAGGGLPFREGWAARYEASPIFRRMIRDQSIFWSAGALTIGIALTVVVCIHQVKKEVAYGVGWATPFVWAAVWAAISVPWVRYELHRERETWETVCTDRSEKGEIAGENGEGSSAGESGGTRS